MEQGTNGYVKWRDLEERMRLEQETLNKRLDRAHNYANERLDTIDADILALGANVEKTRDKEVAAGIQRYEKLDGRVNKIESTLDQQRGAKALVYFLIGSNLMVIVGIVIAILVAVAA